MSVPPSLIQTLNKRVQKDGYQRYLREIHLKNVRAFKDQKIRFDFPVTAVVGTNGGGKSTILGACGMAYKAIKLGEFFLKSNVGDETMSDWRVDYDILDRVEPKEALARHARFASAKWRRENLAERHVLLFPIARTVPASEQTRYRKFIGIQKAENPVINELPPSVRKAAGRILGKNLSEYKIAKLNQSDEDYLLLGFARMNDYSQFHFGAGEASIIQMVSKIEAAEKETLVLIEEIENGLHPLATERMVEYLLDIADAKRIQVIFTTHSEYAVRNLPSNGVWACIDGKAFPGKLSIESLRAIVGTVEKDKVIFVEDIFAKEWVEDIIRQHIPGFLSSVEVHIAGSHSRVVSVTEHHNDNPNVKKKAIAVLDGDAPFEIAPSVFKLPGGVPESEVFGYVSKNAEIYASLIQQRCQCPNIEQDKIITILRKIENESDEPHELFYMLGNNLSWTSELVARRGLISIYNERNRKAIESLVTSLSEFFQADV